MDRTYILTHTPRQIAEEHDKRDIKFEMGYQDLPGDFLDVDGIFGDDNPANYSDEIMSVEEADSLLCGFYDEQYLERPGTAEDMAVAFQLMVAMAYKIDQDFISYRQI